MGWRRLLSDNSDARQGYRLRDNPHGEGFWGELTNRVEYTTNA